MKKTTLSFIFLFSFFYTTIFSQWDNIYHLNSYNDPSGIAIDSQYLWVTTSHGVIQRAKADMSICGIWNSSNSTIDDFPLEHPTIDPSGNFWCTSPNKVFKYDGQTWVDIDTVSNSGLGFNPNETPEHAYYYYTRAGSGGFVLIGHTEIKNDFQGNIWKAETSFWCGGQGVSFQSCYHYVSDISKKSQGGNWITQATFNAPSLQNNHMVKGDDFTIDPDGNLWYMSSDKLIKQAGSFSTEYPLVAEFDSLFFASDSTFYFVKKSNDTDSGYVYTFQNEAFVYDSLLSAVEAFSFEVDEHGDVFGWDKNSVWKIDSTGSLTRYENEGLGLYSMDITKHYFTSSNKLWLQHNNGFFSKFNEGEISIIENTDSSLNDTPIRYHHTDKLGNVWGFYNFYNWGNPTMETQLVQLGETIMSFDTASCGLLTYSIPELFSDTLGNVWFMYQDTVQGMVACQYDGTSWVNHNNTNALLESEAIAEGMHFIKDVLVRKNADGSWDSFPFPDSITYFSGTHQNQISNTGVVWKFIQQDNYSDLWERFIFDGEEWKPFTNLPVKSYYEYMGGMMAVDSGIYVWAMPWPFGTNYHANLKPVIHFHHADGTSKIYNIPYDCDNDPYLYYFAFSKGYTHRNGNLLLSYRAGQFATPYGYCGEYERIIELNGDSLVNSWDVDYSIFHKDTGTIWLSNNNDIGLIDDLESKVVFFEKNNEICEGADVFGVVTNGYSGWTDFDWEDGMTTFQKYLSNGNHNITVNHNNGFTFSESYEMNVLPLNATFEIDSNANQYIIQSLPEGGTMPYTFSWNTGGVSDTIEVTSSGNYVVTITDVNGCDFSQSYNLSIINYSDDIELLAFPNPMYDHITFQYTTAKSGAFQISITDAQGIQKHTEVKNTNAGTHQIDLDLSNYSAGIYFFHIHYGAVIRQLKFVKVVD